MSEVNTIFWHELHSPDIEASREFYAALFGWSSVADQPFDYYSIFKMDGDTVGGGMQHADMADAEKDAYWVQYTLVEDLESRLTAVNEAGGTQVSAIRELPPAGRCVFVAGPEGAPMGLWQQLGGE